MSEQTMQLPGEQGADVLKHMPFVEQLARRVVASMPQKVEIGDLVQDGVIGLIDALSRFDEKRGIKFETFAERRIRGAMIDALRKQAWPRGVRRQRRELEAAREELRREMGEEPSLADLATRMGYSEKRLARSIIRINTIELTSPLIEEDHFDESMLPQALIPFQPARADEAYEREEINQRVRDAIASLPPREQKVIGLYYYGGATMKQIGAVFGINESRVSQLHAKAIRGLKTFLLEVRPRGNDAGNGMHSQIVQGDNRRVLPKPAPAMAQAVMVHAGGNGNAESLPARTAGESELALLRSNAYWLDKFEKVSTVRLRLDSEIRVIRKSADPVAKHRLRSLRRELRAVEIQIALFRLRASCV